jgi:excisionase family DNA binding protein
VPDQLLTVAEIAELLKLSEQTVSNWIDRGELPAVRVELRQVRVRQSDLDRFLAAGATNRAAQRYLVIVYTGSSPPQYVRSFGPFEALDDALAAREGEGLVDAPVDGEWATIIPEP